MVQLQIIAQPTKTVLVLRAEGSSTSAAVACLGARTVLTAVATVFKEEEHLMQGHQRAEANGEPSLWRGAGLQLGQPGKPRGRVITLWKGKGREGS